MLRQLKRSIYRFLGSNFISYIKLESPEEIYLTTSNREELIEKIKEADIKEGNSFKYKAFKDYKLKLSRFDNIDQNKDFEITIKEIGKGNKITKLTDIVLDGSKVS